MLYVQLKNVQAENPINVANVERALRSLQSAKQLRIYLTPSQAIKHFSFIHGRRCDTRLTHTYTHTYHATLTHFPPHANGELVGKIIRIFGTPIVCVFRIGFSG